MLVISKGKEPIEIPDVVGSEESAATTKLEELGFDVKRTEEFSDSVASGIVISQSPAEGTGYKNDVVQINVSKGKAPIAPNNVTLDKTTITLYSSGSNTTAQLSATITPNDANDKTVSWSSSNTSVATVTNNGFVQAVGAGTATIVVKTNTGEKTATCNVEVISPALQLQYVEASVPTGYKRQLNYTATPSNQKITWSSSNPSVVSVDNGNITAVNVGDATIYAKSDYGITSSCSISVHQKCTYSADYTDIILLVGEKVSPGVHVTGSNEWYFKDSNGSTSSGDSATGISIPDFISYDGVYIIGKKTGSKTFNLEPGLTIHVTVLDEYTEYGAWSNWSTTPVTETDLRQVETKQELVYSDWGQWSGWTTDVISSTDLRQVETKEEKSVENYEMSYWSTRTPQLVRQFRDFSINGDFSRYGVQETYGEHHYGSLFVTQGELDAATVIPPGGSQGGSQNGVNATDKNGYALNDGYATYIYFIINTNYSNTTYYRYKERSQEKVTYYRYRERQKNDRLKHMLQLFD